MANRKQIVTKSVAFNLADPDQRRLFEHATKRTNFSAYVKLLIARDMSGWTTDTNEKSRPIDELSREEAEGYI